MRRPRSTARLAAALALAAVLCTPLAAVDRVRRRDWKVTAGDHPRLVFGESDVAALRRKARTAEGKAIVARLRALLKTPDERPDAVDCGFHAAGHGLLHVLDGEARHAEAARKLIKLVMSDGVTHHGEKLWRPGYKMIIRTDPAVGAALSYDLCYDAWSAAFRERVATALVGKAGEFIRGGGKGWNGSASSNWHGNTRSAAGLCALAVLNDRGADGAGVRVGKRLVTFDPERITLGEPGGKDVSP